MHISGIKFLSLSKTGNTFLKGAFRSAGHVLIDLGDGWLHTREPCDNSLPTFD